VTAGREQVDLFTKEEKCLELDLPG
jgi:hypothetical protein